MRVLIADDEPPARARLRRLLASHPDVEIVGEAADAPDAVQQIVRTTPQVAFLDIRMPGGSGLDVAASLPEPAPAVVFVTAYDQYALRAFEAAAVDYLLKPVEPERLGRCLARLRLNAAAGHGPAAPPAQLLVPDRGRVHVVRVSDILWLQAADNYVEIHAIGRSLLMRRTLTALLADLGGEFVRTHRSAAVALTHVTGVQDRGHGDGLVLLAHGAAAPLSRQHRETALARIASR